MACFKAKNSCKFRHFSLDTLGYNVPFLLYGRFGKMRKEKAKGSSHFMLRRIEEMPKSYFN